VPYFIEYSADFFYIENDAKIFPAHYTWKVAEKGFKIAFMMNKLAMIISFKFKKNFLKIKKKIFAKNHCEIQVRTLLVCALYSIKYGTPNFYQKVLLMNSLQQKCFFHQTHLKRSKI
jgi:hypothetical protein